ncbi:MAG TPA: alpha/beta hydrolase [Candidatus Acidoferrum sp.]|nr:alpha/beta hydrolase [Candidatus Acidoferrum sp.]
MISDVAFVRHGDRTLTATLRTPDGAGPFPAVVLVHGGAWTSGDRFGNDVLDEALCAAGVVVLAVDFRMPPEAGYPAAVQDVHAAIRWLKAHARELRSEPALVGAVGSSSGGQTVLLCALRPTDPLFSAVAPEGGADGDASLAFVVACWPIADPPARYGMARERGNAKLVAAHDAYFGDEATMRAASPQRIVEQGEMTSLPPLLVVQGTADENVTDDMAASFVAVYRRAGGDAELRLFDGQPHSFIKSGDPAASTEARALIAEFISERARRVAASR